MAGSASKHGKVRGLQVIGDEISFTNTIKLIKNVVEIDLLNDFFFRILIVFCYSSALCISDMLEANCKSESKVKLGAQFIHMMLREVSFF